MRVQGRAMHALNGGTSPEQFPTQKLRDAARFYKLTILTGRI
jgi:hypothetical protein